MSASFLKPPTFWATSLICGSTSWSLPSPPSAFTGAGSTDATGCGCGATSGTTTGSTGSSGVTFGWMSDMTRTSCGRDGTGSGANEVPTQEVEHLRPDAADPTGDLATEHLEMQGVVRPPAQPPAGGGDADWGSDSSY